MSTAPTHNAGTCPTCNWRHEDAVQFSMTDIVSRSKTGCQFSSYIEQAVQALWNRDISKPEDLWVSLVPLRGTMGLRFGYNLSRSSRDIELCVLEGYDDSGNHNATLPPGISDLEPQRNHCCTNTLRDRLEYIKDLTQKCVYEKKTMCGGLASLKPREIPKRLLAITRSENGNLSVALRENLTAADVPAYTCLSYCWGGDQPLKLTQRTACQLHTGIGIDGLPKTLRDAAFVSDALDVYYIWIDALCIYQDSLEDWAEQASRMGSIYSNGSFTICASRAGSASSGFLQSPVWTKPIALKAIDASCARQVWARPRMPHQTSSGSSLGTRDSRAQMRRAWTYQEYYLSTRCLRFEEDEILWECLEGFACECRPGFWKANSYMLPGEAFPKVFFMMQSSPIMLAVAKHLVPSADIYATKHYFIWYWHNLIEHYWMRDLTEESDRLVALEGIVDVFKWRCSEFFAGIWALKVHWSLGWQISDTSITPEWPRRPGRYRAPSWSWASIEYGGGFRSVQHLDKEPLPVADVVSMTWAGSVMPHLREGQDVLTLWTFIKVKTRYVYGEKLAEGVSFDCGESKDQANGSAQLWFVALSKQEHEQEKEGARFEYQVLVCKEMEEGQLRRLGIHCRITDLDGYTRATVSLV